MGVQFRSYCKSLWDSKIETVQAETVDVSNLENYYLYSLKHLKTLYYHMLSLANCTKNTMKKS